MPMSKLLCGSTVAAETKMKKKKNKTKTYAETLSNQ